MVELHLGDCREILKSMKDNSIDALVCDPPAGISFMGKDWDKSDGFIPFMTQAMKECLRVLKPGAHGLVWAIPRTSHWTATALENAGFQIRDVVTHLFGSGFPKSLDISKAIDKAAGAEREVIGTLPAGTGPLKRGHVASTGGGMSIGTERSPELKVTKPSTPEAKQWQGWGTALKPASEHWILVRKPCSEKTVAANVLKHGTGGINIDASSIPVEVNDPNHRKSTGGYVKTESEATTPNAPYNKTRDATLTQGRFPANLILSHNDDCVEVGVKKVGSGHTGFVEYSMPDIRGDDFNRAEDKPRLKKTGMAYGTETVSAFECTPGCAVAELDRQSRLLKSGHLKPVETKKQNVVYGTYNQENINEFKPNEGGASRFFYCAKASKREKGECNTHPTVKATKLMSYLITMITPTNGIVLDPFMGSGSTGVAAIKLGLHFIGIEYDREYFDIANKRINVKESEG